jgi:hypothetical protein
MSSLVWSRRWYLLRAMLVHRESQSHPCWFIIRIEAGQSSFPGHVWLISSTRIKVSSSLRIERKLNSLAESVLPQFSAGFFFVAFTTAGISSVYISATQSDSALLGLVHPIIHTLHDQGMTVKK